MDDPYIRGLRIQKKSVGKRLYAAICLMLVAALLVSTTSYAWLILSQAPEVTDVTTTLGANGNLEIALATTDHLALLESNNMYDDDSNFEYANGDAVHDNILWGNLIDLTPSDYGLHILNMRPAILNIMDGYVADAPISIGKYGADGRLENLTYDAENINLDTIGFPSVYNTDKANYYAGTVEMSIDDLKSGNYDKEALIQSILDNREYGVRIAGLLDYSATVDQSQNSANIDILVDGYCFAIDLLFRTNAPTANLMLQTEGTQRMESELEDEYVGSGSFVEMDNKRLSAAMKVVFANTLTGEVYALAQADSEGKLWITARADKKGNLVPTAADDAALIKPLTQNQVSAITAWVFIDGSKVDNSAATTLVATAAKINLQFSTDAVLNPAYTDITTNPNYPNRPEIPVDPDTPVGPEIPAAAEYFISADGEDNYTIYTLAGSGRRDYELHFTGSLDESTNTVTLNHVSEYPKKGIIIPACVMLSESETEYAVQIDPTQGPFADLETENASVFFVPVDGKKVSATSNVLSNLFYQTGKDNLYDLDKVFVSLDLSGLDTSTATDMRELFRGCSRLTYLNLDGVDTSNVTDMSYMFVNCEALTALDVSGFNTAKVTEMQYLFSGCAGLTELDVQNFNTENVWNMEYMFNECSSLTKLDVSSFNTSSVYYMRGMFDSCSGLTELNLSNFDTANVGDMRNIFSQCTALKKLNVNNFNTDRVENMNCMFSGCSGLTELDLSSFNTENVTDMQMMFSRCSNLAELDLSNFNTQKVEKMNSMFSGCTNLTKLDVSNFDTENVWNMGSIFSGCASLTRLDLSSWDVSNIEYNVILDDVFGNCKNLYIIVTPKEIGYKTIELPGTYQCEVDGKTYTSINSWVPTQAVLKNVALDDPSAEPDPTLPTEQSKVTADDGNVYYFTEGTSAASYEIYTLKADKTKDYQLPVTATLSESAKTLTITSVNSYPASGVIIPAVVTTDGETEYTVVLKAYDKPFYSLNTTDASITFVAVNKQQVGLNGTSIRNLFATDSSTTLATLDVAALDTSGVTTMYGAFYNCTSLVSLNISGWDTSSVTDMSIMFYGCGGLTELDVSGFDTSKVTDMGSMFQGCGSLKALDVSGFDTSNVTNMASMFSAGNSALTELDVSGFDTAKVTDMGGMFHGCSNVTTLDVSGFDTSNVTDMNWMFYNCSSLTELDVTGFDTSNVIEMYHMFSGCSGLTEIDVSGFNTSKATNICYMFMNCSGLTKLDVSNFDTANVTNMGSMFRECSGLTELDLSGFDTSNVTDMHYMFYNCSKLTDLNLSGWDMSNVTNTTNMFYNCPAGAAWLN